MKLTPRWTKYGQEISIPVVRHSADKENSVDNNDIGAEQRITFYVVAALHLNMKEWNFETRTTCYELSMSKFGKRNREIEIFALSGESHKQQEAANRPSVKHL